MDLVLFAAPGCLCLGGGVSGRQVGASRSPTDIVSILLDPFVDQSRSGVWMATIAELVDRSAQLKHELLEFSWHPRFDRDRELVLRNHFRDRVVGDESEIVAALDYFLLQHELRSGLTVVQRFVTSRPDLPESERELLLGWCDVVEGVFEVHSRDGDALVVENLIDDLTYRVYSNIGTSVFRHLMTGDFMIGRIVPIGSAWLMSGNFLVQPKRRRVQVRQLAYEIVMDDPAKAFRNPDKLARARELQRVTHDRFLRFFESDFLIVPGAALTERMCSFYRFCQEEAEAELARQGAQPERTAEINVEYSSDLIKSDLVAIIHDEVDGLGLYAGFGSIERAFSDPDELRDPDVRQRIRDYLDDPSVSPLLFERLAARSPENANEVFRKVLRRKHFDWVADGDKMMRRRKAEYFGEERLPYIVPLSEKLLPYARGA
jgi:hypothetical protein